MLLFLIADIMLLIEIHCVVIRLICELQPRVHVLHWVHAGDIHLGLRCHVFWIRGPLGGGMCRWQLCVVGISYLPTVQCLRWILLPCGVDVGGRHRVRRRVPLPRWGQRQTRSSIHPSYPKRTNGFCEQRFLKLLIRSVLGRNITFLP